MSRLALVVTLLALSGDVASAQIAPAVDVRRAAHGHQPHRPAAPRLLPIEAGRLAWLRAPCRPTASSASRLSKTDRVVAIAAGAFLGFWGGARLGYAVTTNDRDDTSGLRGVVIGAPLGAVVGAVVGYRLTR